MDLRRFLGLSEGAAVQLNPKDVAVSVAIFAGLYVGYKAIKGVSDAAGAVSGFVGSVGDAFGNAWEWTSDAFKPNPYRESITSMEEVVYDEMGNVIGTRTVDAPSGQQTVFTNEQIDRISGGWNWGFGDLTGGGFGGGGKSFNDILKGGY